MPDTQSNKSSLPTPDVAASGDEDARSAASRRNRELIVLGVSLLAGFVILPIAIFAVGTLTLGPYAGGKSLGVFYSEFFRNLGQGAPRTWFVALSPYLAVWSIRLIFKRNRWDRPPVDTLPSAPPPAQSAGREGRREPFISS